MKIKSIKKMKNIGLLNELAYTNANLFIYYDKKDNQNKCYSKNLIKGNNGTGKTTLANLLYSIEKNDINILNKLKKIDENETIDVEIELEDGTIVKYDNSSKQWINTDKLIIQVFNEDYIKDNMNFDEFNKTNKINGKYETPEVKISVEKNNYEKSKKALEANKKEQDVLKEELKKLKDSTNSCIVREFDTYCKIDINLDNLSNVQNEQVEKRQLQSEINDKLKVFKNYKSAENFILFPVVNISKLDDNVKNRMIELLKYTEDLTKISFINEILKESKEKRIWIDTGLTYIQRDNLCPFCHKTLDNNIIIEKYQTYKNSKIKENEVALNKCKTYFRQFIENKKFINELSIKLQPYISMLVKKEINFDDNKLENIVDDIVAIIDKKLNNMQNAIDEEELSKLDNYIKDLKVEIGNLYKINEQATEINMKMSKAKNN